MLRRGDRARPFLCRVNGACFKVVNLDMCQTHAVWRDLGLWEMTTVDNDL